MLAYIAGMTGVMESTIDDQTEFTLGVSSDEWEWAQGLIRDVEGQKEFFEAVANWNFTIRHIRRIEVQRMYLAEPTERDIRNHRLLITALISIGEMLLSQAQKNPKIVEHTHFTAKDVDSQIRSLRHSYDEWHSVEKPKTEDLKTKSSVKSGVKSAVKIFVDTNRKRL